MPHVKLVQGLPFLHTLYSVYIASVLFPRIPWEQIGNCEQRRTEEVTRKSP